MSINRLIEVFIAGLMLGNGPCLFFCIPIIIPFISGLPELDSGVCGWKMGLKLASIFSISRLFAYSLLGFLVVVTYKSVFAVLDSKAVYLYLILGILIIIIGMFYLLNIYQHFSLFNLLCKFIHTMIAKNSKFPIVLSGLLIGFSPCLPLLSTLTYIAATAEAPIWGFIGGFSFGLGTLITPLIPFGTFAGFVVDKIKKYRAPLLIIRFLSGAILIYFGTRLVLNFIFI